LSDDDLRYPQEFTDCLEIIWGEGFLSPGGAGEVRLILDGIDLVDKTLLEVVDEAVYLHWMKIRRAFRDSAAVGALRPTHLRAYKV
jgi:hypothetical protein